MKEEDLHNSYREYLKQLILENENVRMFACIHENVRGVSFKNRQVQNQTESVANLLKITQRKWHCRKVKPKFWKKYVMLQRQ